MSETESARKVLFVKNASSAFYMEIYPNIAKPQAFERKYW